MSEISNIRLRDLEIFEEVARAHSIREVARRLLRVHPLRAADALQLAAAYIIAERRPPTLAVVTLDDRVAAAGAKEGFLVVRPS